MFIHGSTKTQYKLQVKRVARIEVLRVTCVKDGQQRHLSSRTTSYQALAAGL